MSPSPSPLSPAHAADVEEAACQHVYMAPPSAETRYSARAMPAEECAQSVAWQRLCFLPERGARAGYRDAMMRASARQPLIRRLVFVFAIFRFIAAPC
ncbi:hypothetical protein AVEN_267945-1 [Araneus ventricosus]|uniref:Uncharacterized protein n=1 Tax=Araneus ventricosus TaxID=182803 RepID=A0A4Y2FWL0_ARAVE|nr:hypothetical protein AVEN_267945-1 [Araneus ventricosus]